MIRRPPRSPLFPSPTLSRSGSCTRLHTGDAMFQIGHPLECGVSGTSHRQRSEEHTSELQSQSNLVCRLLLEKKKKERNSLTLKKSQNTCNAARSYTGS